MKDQAIITFAVLSLLTVAIPSANADTSSSVVTTGEHGPNPQIATSVKTESASDAEASDTPAYADSLKKDEIIEKHKHHVLLSNSKRRPSL